MDEWTRVKQLSACYITPQQSSTFCFLLLHFDLKIMYLQIYDILCLLRLILQPWGSRCENNTLSAVGGVKISL